MRPLLLIAAVALVQPYLTLSVPAENESSLPKALDEMIATERAFARRADETSVQRAFLDFFADDAIGFNEGSAEGAEGNAREQFRRWPHPPRNVEFHWEPRYGDVSASGDLGYLTGPVWSRVPAFNEGRPRHGNYVSVWKRQKDGSFKVVMDVGMNAPDRVSFPLGFTRAPHSDRYSGSEGGSVATETLKAADEAFMSALKKDPEDAYNRFFAPRGRLHRSGSMPIEGRSAASVWHKGRPRWNAGDSRYAESAQAGDLGYTWGTYSYPAGADTAPESGYYLRTWTRDSNRRWLVAIDVTTARKRN